MVIGLGNFGNERAVFAEANLGIDAVEFKVLTAEILLEVAASNPTFLTIATREIVRRSNLR